MTGVFEDDNFEVDMIVGDKTEEIRGLRIMQMVEFEEEEDKEADAKANAEVDELPDLEGEEEKEGDEEDTEIVEVLGYDFVVTKGAKLEGTPLFKIEMAKGNEEEGEEDGESAKEEATELDDADVWLTITVYADEEMNLSGAMIVKTENPDEPLILVEDEGLE